MKRGYMVAALLIGLCGVTAAYSLRGATVSHLSFARARESRESCEIYGKLLPQSIQLSRGMTHARFTLEDDKTAERIDVLYDHPTQPVAANFQSASHTRAVGTYDPSRKVFVATQLIMKCPSKYESEGYTAGKKPPAAESLVRPAAAQQQ